MERKKSVIMFIMFNLLQIYIIHTNIVFKTGLLFMVFFDEQFFNYIIYNWKLLFYYIWNEKKYKLYIVGSNSYYQFVLISENIFNIIQN